MPLKLEKISPEDELQQHIEQLDIVDNDGYECDVDDNVGEYEGESNSNDQGQEHKPASDNNNNNTGSEKRWSDEKTCRSEDSSHEIGSNVTNNNDKDVASSVESDISLPKHRKDYPSDDERTDSEPLSNEEEEMGSEDSLTSSRRFLSPSEAYEQITPIKPSNTQANGMNVPYEVSPMSLGESSLQDDIDVEGIVNPIVRCITDLKSEFRTQMAKLHYCPDPNLDGLKIDDSWQHTEFEKSQDQYRYDAIVTAGKLLDVIMPLQLPEEAKERLSQARKILLEKALLYRISSSTENINSSSPQAAYDVDPAIVDSALVTSPDNAAGSSNAHNNNKSSEEIGLSRSNQNSATIATKAESQTSTKLIDVTTNNNESNNNDNATSYKYRRGSNQGRKLRRHSSRGSSAYSSPNSGRRNPNYSPRTSNVRSPRIGSAVTSSIAGSTTNLNAKNRRFVGFLPSRCFTCGGIGHFASNCGNKGSYITTSITNTSRRRRTNTSSYRRTTESMANNATSNE